MCFMLFAQVCGLFSHFVAFQTRTSLGHWYFPPFSFFCTHSASVISYKKISRCTQRKGFGVEITAKKKTASIFSFCARIRSGEGEKTRSRWDQRMTWWCAGVNALWKAGRSDPSRERAAGIVTQNQLCARDANLSKEVSVYLRALLN